MNAPDEMNMKKKMRILAIALIAILAVGMLAGCGKKSENAAPGSSAAAEDSKELTKITVALDWTPNTNHTGLYVAKEMGWFEEAGLDVEIVQPPEDGAEAMVGAGQAQFGISFQDMMAALVAGKEKSVPITAVAGIIQHNTSGIMSRAGEGITTPAGMEGKKYATWEWEIEHNIIRQCMEDEGADFSKVELLPVTVEDEVAALTNKQIDCVWVYYAW